METVSHRHIPHLALILTLLALAGSVEVIRLTHYSLTAIVSVSMFASSISVAIGFGLQGYLSGIIAGMALRAERRIRVGQTITVNGLTGTLLSIDLRTSDLDTGTDVVSVPNVILFSSPVIHPKETACPPT